MSRPENTNEQLFSKLKNDWQQLDELGTPSIPTTESMKEHLHLTKTEKKKAFQKEFGVFIVVAFLILIAFTTALLQAPIVFLIIQGAAVILAPIIFILLPKKKQEGSLLS